MWRYQDCVEEFANRRRGSDYKKTHHNVYMRHESGDDYSMFIFKMYHTDIVKVRMDLNTNRYAHILQVFRYGGSSTTRERVRDISDVSLSHHPQSPTWRPQESLRTGPYAEPRRFKLGDKVVAVHGYPFTDGMVFRNGVPEGDFREEKFKIIDPAVELERKRLLRPWLEGIKVAIELTYDSTPKDWAELKHAPGALLDRIARNEPFDMAPVLDLVHYEWSRRDSGAQKGMEDRDDMGKIVYKEVTDFLFRETRREVPEIMVTGYLLDERK